MPVITRKRAREAEILAITAGKSARNEENNEDHNTDGESSGVSEESLGNGDTEIFSTLIPMMRNVNILKTCRLVCKSWNQFACRALRKHSRVYYSVVEYNADETRRNLKLIKGNVHLGLPSPFRIFKITATSFQEKTFWRFLKYLEGTKSDFLMYLTIDSDYDGVHQAKMQAVLTCNQNKLKITKLTLKGSILNDGSGSVFKPEAVRLPYLRTLRIMEGSLDRDKVASLCENICRYSPLLRSLTIKSSTLGVNFDKVMSSLAMKSIDKLCMEFSGICRKTLSLEDWELIRTRIVKIPGIKKLTIDNRHHRRSCVGHDLFNAIIDHFAGSLESLGGTLPRLHNQYFPKLQEIKYKGSDFDFDYPEEWFPLLKKATFLMGSYDDDIVRDIAAQPNLEIQQLSFKTCFGGCPEAVLQNISLAGRCFPNVSNFSFKQSKGVVFTSEILRVICMCFPSLTAFELGMNLEDEKILSGFSGRKIFVETLDSARLFCEMIPRGVSLLDLTALQKLSLGPDAIVTRHLFLYCLSKMAKLQYLTFYLNGDVSAKDVRDSVGHLTRIKVIVLESLDPKYEWVEEMERLRIMLPGVVEIKKKLYEVYVDFYQ